jgi:Bacterial protein of unknown function (DUF882)
VVIASSRDLSGQPPLKVGGRSFARQIIGRDPVNLTGSWYRTPWSNEFLRSTTSGVASHSLHMEGEAIDIRIPGVPTAQLRDAALALHRGGVGYYRNLNSYTWMLAGFVIGDNESPRPRLLTF